MDESKNSPSRPEWLDDKFVKNCIKTDVGLTSIEDIDLHDVKIQYVVPKGENYATVVLRVIAHANIRPSNSNNHLATNGSKPLDNGRRYILKVPNTVGAVKILMDELSAYKREVDMYVNLMPKYETILKDIGLETKLSCRCVHFIDEFEVFAMEDLGVEKYILGNRVHGADFEHTKLVMQKLARLHGASMAVYEQNQMKDLPAYYFQGMFQEREDEHVREALDAVFGKTSVRTNTKGLANDLRKGKGYEKEAELMDQIADIGFELLCEMCRHKPDHPLNALLHGDTWLNNMLFKYNVEGKPIDLLFLDLQVSYINSATHDFMYFFLSSTSDDVRQHHYDDTVNYYYDNLIETLTRMGYKGTKPSLALIHKELVKSSSILLLVMSGLAMMKTQHGEEAQDRSKEEAFSLEDLHEIMANNRNNPVYLKTLFLTTDLLRDIGAFEYHAELLKSHAL